MCDKLRAEIETLRDKVVRIEERAKHLAGIDADRILNLCREALAP